MEELPNVVELTFVSCTMLFDTFLTTLGICRREALSIAVSDGDLSEE